MGGESSRILLIYVACVSKYYTLLNHKSFALFMSKNHARLLVMYEVVNKVKKEN